MLSDGWPGFTQVSSLVQCREPRITGHGPNAAKHPAFHWVNTLLANLKTMLPRLMQAAALIKSEMPRWAKVVNDAKIELE